MIPVMRACVDPNVRRVTLVCASQMSKSETALNVICHRLDDDPVPILYVGPTRSNVEKVIEPRLMAALKSSKRLWSTLTRAKMGKTAKRISGVLVRLGWAGSATELASQEAGLAVLDEIDRMELDVEGEGSPIELVDARLATFQSGKMLLTSSPTEGNVVEERDPVTGLVHWKVAETGSVGSSIWKMWQEGSRHEWAWPCPECLEYFVPRRSLLEWTPNDATATPVQAFRTARLACPHCGALIEDGHKRWMNERGLYVAPGQSARDGVVSGPEPETDHLSFWVSGMCSPWRSFGHRARALVEARLSHDHERIKTVTNTGFGELYRMGGEAPEWQDVMGRAGGYLMGEVPKGAEWLTCGVDVQKDRLIAAVRGWGYGLESWLVRFEEIWGDTSHPETWARLRELVLEREYAGLTIRKCVIDSGYKPGEESSDHIVYAFCRQMGGVVVPAKGHDRLEKLTYASQIDIRENGKLIKNGLQLWHIDSDRTKGFVHGRLRLELDADGRFHLPSDVTESYCQELVAEARVATLTGHATWVRLRKANHALDCEAMNVAAIHMLGGHMMVRPRAADAKETAAETPPTPSPPLARSNNPGARWAASPPAGNNFVTGWRR